MKMITDYQRSQCRSGQITLRLAQVTLDEVRSTTSGQPSDILCSFKIPSGPFNENVTLKNWLQTTTIIQTQDPDFKHADCNFTKKIK